MLLQAADSNSKPPSAAAPVRVAFLDHTAKLGGGEIALLNLLASLDRSRFEPVVVLFSDGPLKTKLQEIGIDVRVEPLDGNIINARKDGLGTKSILRLLDLWRTLRFSVRLAGTIKRLRVDLVHTNSLKSDLIGGVASRLAGIPLVWHVRDRIASDYLPPLVAFTFRILARFIPDRVVVNSSATLQTLRPTTRADSPATDLKRYVVVHDGTNVLDPEPPFMDRANGDFLIGLIGRITPWKGQDIFLQSAAIVSQHFPRARFQIVGSAMFGEEAYERQVRALASTLLPPDVVEFTGFREDVLDLIGKMDLVAHASTRGEPFGQVIIEGMAAGKAIVATNGGGVPEFVNNGQTGLLVPMGDAPAMAQAILNYLADPALRLHAGALGRQRIKEHFTLQHTAQKIQRVFEDLLVTSRHRSRRNSASPQSDSSMPWQHVGQ